MERKLNPSQSILSLDVGDARIGVARAGVIARLPEPLPVLNRDEHILTNLADLIKKENIGLIVVGIPRNLNGEETVQSEKIRLFAGTLSELGVPLRFADESLSSARADQYLAKTKSSAAQDSIAACYILEEFFTTMGDTYEIFD